MVRSGAPDRNECCADPPVHHGALRRHQRRRPQHQDSEELCAGGKHGQSTQTKPVSYFTSKQEENRQTGFW